MASHGQLADWERERQALRDELENVTAELNAALESSQQEVEQLKVAHIQRGVELTASQRCLQELNDKCKNLENEIKSRQTGSQSQPAEQVTAGRLLLV